MPETPKFKKKSTVKSFFSRIASSIARENIPEGEVRPTEQQQSSVATRDTVEQFRIYPTLAIRAATRKRN